MEELLFDSLASEEALSEESIIEDNASDNEDLDAIDTSELLVYARDWTIETIISQIKAGNIELNPKFQRRNAWDDERRSKLIESVVIGYPIPEIVLAEDPVKKKSFIVIDGKQRLLTLAGFVDPNYSYWDKPFLRKLIVRDDLNTLYYTNFDDQTKREFDNSSLRCTVITWHKSIDVLFDIFYRLNSGSVSLSTQELRQSLNRGCFSDFLLDITNTLQPIHQVLGINKPDKRMKDMEIILRIISFLTSPGKYSGNLKKFLDDQMSYYNEHWIELEKHVKETYSLMNQAISNLFQVFGDYKKIGRKATENRFNKALFEVEVYYFSKIQSELLTDKSVESFICSFNKLCEDSLFRDSIERTTKTLENYNTRYTKFLDIVNSSFGCEISNNPFSTHE